MVATLARAQAPDPDTQAARRHYQRGLGLYDQERYDDAIQEFNAAKELKPLPAFDYNIGRCQERLERWEEAAASYEHYLAATPDAPESATLEERIGVLRDRARRHDKPPNPAPPLPPPATPQTLMAAPAASVPPKQIYKRGWFWGVVVGGVAVVAVGVGLGVGLSAHGAGDSSHPIMYVTF